MSNRSIYFKINLLTFAEQIYGHRSTPLLYNKQAKQYGIAVY